MKEQNDIDQLFKSKLNNQSFELKDSYLANFESKLDVYNKKGKGYIWLILGSLCAFTLLFDFVLLPKHIETSHLATSKIVVKDKGEKHIKKESNFYTKEIKVNKTKSSNLIEETKIKDLIKNPTNPTYNKLNENTNLKNSKKLTIKKQQNKSLNTNKSFSSARLKEEVKTIEKEKKSKLIDSITSAIETPIKIEEIKKPDVYIDDTIRRKVIVVDTIIQYDTIIINDTIKNKIRLTKKKR